MPYLLDTNICIYIIKQKPISVLERFNTISLGEIGISMITVSELAFGARKSSDPTKNLATLHQFLTPFDLFNFDYKATIEYGIIRSVLELRGTSIGPLDTLIAAHAKSLRFTLVTNNTKEFSRVAGLEIENWV